MSDPRTPIIEGVLYDLALPDYDQPHLTLLDGSVPSIASAITAALRRAEAGDD